jgi:hypothetical protein
MITKLGLSISRRHLAAAGLGAGAAQKKGIVPTMIDAAAQSKIQTHSVRRGISVLQGSGGNIGRNRDLFRGSQLQC